MKNILILYPGQFGYHTGLFMYDKYINENKYKLHFVCFDLGLKKIQSISSCIYYIPIERNKIKQYLNYFINLKKIYKNEKIDLIFHVNTKYTLLYRFLFLFQKMILDIRTGDLSDNRVKLWIKNKQIWFASLFYSRVSIISESLRKELKISKTKSFILPLGAEFQNINSKKFDSLNLLYIGTLNKRQIDDTIVGLKQFLNLYSTKLKTSFDIIGYGESATIAKLEKAIIDNKLSQIVKFHGRKSITENSFYFKKCNVGVSYIPKKKYYDVQPATKTFEYLLAGMPVIATSTYENTCIVNNSNGVLCEDKSFSFASGLQQIVENFDKYNSERIKKDLLDYDWKEIVQGKLSPLLNEELKEK